MTKFDVRNGYGGKMVKFHEVGQKRLNDLDSPKVESLYATAS